MRILVVEDEPTLGRQLRATLEGAGYAVDLATDGEDGHYLGSTETYDAITILAMAINKAGKTEPEAIRAALIGVKKFPGVEGEYNFDANGDGLHGYNIVRNEKGTIVFEKHIDFND